ncbi:hypothetical protein ACWGJ2_19615 [Streptomyces sp. NPDC054796]
MSDNATGRPAAALPAEADPACAGIRERRLAELLADMVPGARTIRVSQREPSQVWPSPYARACDAQGQLLALNRPQSLAAARWVIRAHSELAWDEPYDLDLASGVLRATVEGHAVAAGGC